jgi:hypothetical protein
MFYMKRHAAVKRYLSIENQASFDLNIAQARPYWVLTARQKQIARFYLREIKNALKKGNNYSELSANQEKVGV